VAGAAGGHVEAPQKPFGTDRTGVVANQNPGKPMNTD
jgi:hypothetical protein